MPKLEALRKELVQRQRESVSDVVEFNVFDALGGDYNIVLLTDKFSRGVICPSRLEKCHEILNKIERCQPVRVRAKLQYFRIREVVDIEELDLDAVDFDFYARVKSSSFGYVATRDGKAVFLRDTVNTSKLEELLQQGVDEFVFKLVGVQETNGRTRAAGAWFFPAWRQHEAAYLEVCNADGTKIGEYIKQELESVKESADETGGEQQLQLGADANDAGELGGEGGLPV